jgi:uncharacterized membrane protein YeaQ/YmgE (transglycosylase-associated protein family)
MLVLLEILAIIYLCKLNRRIAEKKGHKSGRYKFFTVLLWIGGEILGVVLALSLASEGDDTGPVYLFSLVGALIGAGVSRLIVSNLPSVPALQTEVFD